MAEQPVALRANVSIAQLDFVLVPFNVGGVHWVLLAVDLMGRQFIYLDSLHHGDHYRGVPVLRRWLYHESLINEGRGLRR